MIDFLFNPNGRVSRKGYFLGFLIPQLLATMLGSTLVGGVGYVAMTLFFFWPSTVAIPVKRFHDMGISGIYQLGLMGLHLLAGLILVQGLGEAGLVQSDASVAGMPFDINAAEDIKRAQLGALLLVGVQLASLALFGLVRGEKGANRFGNDPLSTKMGWGD